jgi:hypothetical protein
MVQMKRHQQKRPQREAERRRRVKSRRARLDPGAALYFVVGCRRDMLKERAWEGWMLGHAWALQARVENLDTGLCDATFCQICVLVFVDIWSASASIWPILRSSGNEHSLT